MTFKVLFHVLVHSIVLRRSLIYELDINLILQISKRTLPGNLAMQMKWKELIFSRRANHDSSHQTLSRGQEKSCQLHAIHKDIYRHMRHIHKIRIMDTWFSVWLTGFLLDSLFFKTFCRSLLQLLSYIHSELLLMTETLQIKQEGSTIIGDSIVNKYVSITLQPVDLFTNMFS